MMINISNRLMFHDVGEPTNILSYHHPYLLAMGDRKLITVGERIKKIGQYETYKSWWNPDRERKVFRVYVDHPASTPKVADDLFNQGLNVMEFDVKYVMRVLADLAVDKDIWLFDSKGNNRTLKVLVYDIEDPAGIIQVIGYYQFEIKIKSSKNLKTEDFKFEIKKIPDAKEMLGKYNKGLLKISQLTAKNQSEEVLILHKFISLVMNSHIISGHNIYSYDNAKVVDRINHYVKNKGLIPTKKIHEDFERFLRDYVYDHVGWNKKFGRKERAVFFYPTSFDTLPIAETFMRYLDTPNYSLKKLVPSLGFHVKNRTYLMRHEIKYDNRTFKYNRDDVMEQLCLTILLLQQALPIAFVSNYPFELLGTTGHIQHWDYMTFIRAYLKKIILPPSVSPLHVASELVRTFPDKIKISKEDIEQYCRKSDVKGDLKKIGRYGPEMANWATLPRIVMKHSSVGGLPLKPQELHSQYVMWYGVVEADVQGMYPNIVIAKNACSDKVRFAKPNEKPDDWILFWTLDESSRKYLNAQEVTTVIGKKALKVGIKIAKEKGLVAYPMGGILKMVGEVRKHRKDNDIMQNMYAALKALRNAGTHGIVLAVKWANRQFNLASGDLITSKGQDILSDIYTEYDKMGVRTVYGDTDGVYAACYKSAYKVKGLVKALMTTDKDELDSLFGDQKKKAKTTKLKKGYRITTQKKVLDIIDKLNKRWQKKLNYPGFAFEVDKTPAMIISMHKNYIKILVEEKTGEVKVKLKGANFTAKDKPNVAEDTLKRVILETVKDNLEWKDEQTSAMNINATIRRKMSNIAPKLNPEEVELKDLVLIQSVQAPEGYKSDKGIHYKRAVALENMIGKIQGSVRLDFVVTKKPLPGLEADKKNVSIFKPTVKPIAFMTPVDSIKNRSEIDFMWYQQMIVDYISGAFSFDKKQIRKIIGDGKTNQMDLASFM